MLVPGHCSTNVRQGAFMDHEPPLQATVTVSVNGVAFAHGDLFRVVDAFYAQVAVDPVLRVPFQTVQHWPEHIARLTHFWWIRFGGRAYLATAYNPVIKHAAAGFNDDLLQRWLTLFHATVQAHLAPVQADLWIRISTRMGSALSVQNDQYLHYRDRDAAP